MLHNGHDIHFHVVASSLWIGHLLWMFPTLSHTEPRFRPAVKMW